ncbi:MAG: mevalonate kinase [Candidatus Njordarchaeales archaeon]
MPEILKAFSPCKIILFGEHAVVYGYPAIAMALDLGTEVILKESDKEGVNIISENYGISWNPNSYEKTPLIFKPFKRVLEIIAEKFPQKAHLLSCIEIKITTKAPPASGLGTSASTAVAFTAVLLNYLGIDFSQNLVNEIAYEAERVSHGNPSGIDNFIATYGGIIKFVRTKQGAHFERLDISENFPLLLVCTGVERRTKEAVEAVAKLRERAPDIVNRIFKMIGEISERAWTMFRENRIDLRVLGDLMNINHGLLSAIGVSSDVIEEVIYLLRENGAIGAKLTGAGIGGCVIGLFRNWEDVESAKRNIEKKFYCLTVKPQNQGVYVKTLM